MICNDGVLYVENDLDKRVQRFCFSQRKIFVDVEMKLIAACGQSIFFAVDEIDTSASTRGIAANKFLLITYKKNFKSS